MKTNPHFPERPHFPDRLIIKVTADHIKAAKHEGCNQNCPIALAILDKLGDKIDKKRFYVQDNITFYNYVADSNQRVYRYRYNMPEKFLDFITAFDNKEKVEPISGYIKRFYISTPNLIIL